MWSRPNAVKCAEEAHVKGFGNALGAGASFGGDNDRGLAMHALCVHTACVGDVNVRVPEEMLADVRKVLALLRDHPQYGPMRLSQTALVRLAISKGLEAIRTEVGKAREPARRNK